MHELCEDLELGGGQRHGFAVFAQDERFSVEFERAEGDGVRRGGRGRFRAELVIPPQRRLDICHDLERVERLGEVGVRADVQAEHLVGFHGFGGQDDDGQVAEGAHLPDQLIAVHTRHHDICNHERNAARADRS